MCRGLQLRERASDTCSCAQSRKTCSVSLNLKIETSRLVDKTLGRHTYDIGLFRG